MKVLLVILHADSTRGGAESYCVHLLQGLQQREIDARIASASFESRIDQSDRIELSLSGLTRSGKYVSFLDSLESHLSENAYDIVHAMLPVRRCDVYHPQAGVESITFPRTNALQKLTNRRRALFAQVERSLIESNRPPTVLCMSNRSREETRSVFLIDPSRLITLYNGVESDRFNPDPARPIDDPPRVVLVGQDFARKGVDLAIRAVAAVPNVVLDVVGKDDPSRFLALVNEFRVASRVRFLGATGEVETVLAGATALIHPARFEPFGMVVPEAMLMGVPPIVSKISGASEIVRDGIDGRSVDTDDGYAQAIEQVLANHESMRQACLKRRAELSYAAHLDKLLKIYESIVAAKR